MNAWDIKREMAIQIWRERIKVYRASGMSIDLWCAANKDFTQPVLTVQSRGWTWRRPTGK